MRHDRSGSGLAGVDRGPPACGHASEGWRAAMHGARGSGERRGGEGNCREETCECSDMDARKRVSKVSVNGRAAVLVERLVADADELKVGVARGSLGELLIDARAEHLGSIAAGLRIAEICMGGLGEVALEPWST